MTKVKIYVLDVATQNRAVTLRMQRNYERRNMSGRQGRIEKEYLSCEKCSVPLERGEKIISKAGARGYSTSRKYYHLDCARRLNII